MVIFNNSNNIFVYLYLYSCIGASVMVQLVYIYIFEQQQQHNIEPKLSIPTPPTTQMKPKPKTTHPQQQQTTPINTNTNQDTALQTKLLQIYPNKPYDTQLNISIKLYNILNSNKYDVVIVESPTGTGKTYALLVGVLGWLIDNKYALQTHKKQDKQKQEVEQGDSSSEYPSWLNKKTQQTKHNKILNQYNKNMQQVMTIKQYKQTRNKHNNHKDKHKDKQKDNTKNNGNTNGKMQWQVQDIEDIGDDGGCGGIKRYNPSINNNMGYDMVLGSQLQFPKIIFVSRTHTQLAQVLQSIQQLNLAQPVNAISLASKDHLCIHPQLQKSHIHQKCQYLQSHGGCPYYTQYGLHQFLNLPIPNAKKLGQAHHICSYYSIKHLQPICQIVCMPYSTILNPQIRNKLNIKLNNSIVVFDQAHNVIEQELAIKSPSLGYLELQKMGKRVKEYVGKYGAKMREENLGLVRHIGDIVGALLIVVEKYYQIHKKNEGEDQPSYVRLTKIQLFRQLKLAQIRIHKIKNYISLSNLDQKLCHFNPDQQFPISIINRFLQFITMLTSSTANDSTIVLIKFNTNTTTNKQSSSSSQMSQCQIKIYSMQSSQLASIVKECRLAILAGGTMQPINTYANIFRNQGLKWQIIKGKHVIKKQQCNVYCISGTKKTDKTTNKQTKYKLTFTYSQLKHNQTDILTHLSHILKDIIIRKTQKNAGTVIFIQNYNLIQKMYNYLGSSIQGIAVYYDSPNANVQHDDSQQGKGKNGKMNAFEKYQDAIKERKMSAVLVSVMGGRLSQGINFSDQLARAIVVVGLPYPNIKSAQICQKMKYLDTKLQKSLSPTQKQSLFSTAKQHYKRTSTQTQNQDNKQSGQSYYENCCIKVINQTIGRGIRHINDYANIYLIDSRFEGGIYRRLPDWMSDRVKFMEYYQC